MSASLEPRPTFQVGDLVKVRPEFRRKFNDGSPAASGETTEIVRWDGCAYGLGFLPRDYVYGFELDLVQARPMVGAPRPGEEPHSCPPY